MSNNTTGTSATVANIASRVSWLNDPFVPRWTTTTDPNVPLSLSACIVGTNVFIWRLWSASTWNPVACSSSAAPSITESPSATSGKPDTVGGMSSGARPSRPVTTPSWPTGAGGAVVGGTVVGGTVVGGTVVGGAVVGGAGSTAAEASGTVGSIVGSSTAGAVVTGGAVVVEVDVVVVDATGMSSTASRSVVNCLTRVERFARSRSVRAGR